VSLENQPRKNVGSQFFIFPKNLEKIVMKGVMRSSGGATIEKSMLERGYVEVQVLD
jgi:hypothetical protein